MMADQSLTNGYMKPAEINKTKSIAKSAMLGLTIFALGVVTILGLTRTQQSTSSSISSDSSNQESTPEPANEDVATLGTDTESEAIEANDESLTEDESNRAEDGSEPVRKPDRISYGGVTVEIGQVIRLNKVFFDMDRATLSDQSIPELTQLVTFLNENPSVAIEIGGHTNQTKSKDYSTKLSLERAKAVYQYLVAGGVNTSRLRAKGYGYSVPVTADDGSQAALNRRVEFKVTRI